MEVVNALANYHDVINRCMIGAAIQIIEGRLKSNLHGAFYKYVRRLCLCVYSLFAYFIGL